MKHIGIYTLIIYGLFYFSEGKPCPEKTRPHKTRCEVYYKCMELPSKMHVWVPAKCEPGLVYEHDLKMCVLPEEDWECTLGDTGNTQSERNPQKKSITKNSNSTENEVETSQQELKTEKEPHINTEDADIYIVSNEDDIDERENDSSEEQFDSQYEASGEEEELELDGLLQAQNRETEVDLLEPKEPKEPEVQVEPPKTTTTPPSISSISGSSSTIDPNLTAHLQRLSQLIDGLKGTYQSNEKNQLELRPDQLNAFLAHFNIKNKFETLNPNDAETNYEATHVSSTTVPTPLSTSSLMEKLQKPSKNKTLLQEHLSLKLEPETKVVLNNYALPKRYGNSDYANSQIVVNRPEGSVMFNLPPSYNTETHYTEHGSSEYNHNSPKISEDTLKTVLELSKQMMATQHLPNVIPNPAYYPQTILPLFIAPSSFPPQAQGSPFSSYNLNSNNNNDNYGHNSNKYVTSMPSYNKHTSAGQSQGYKKYSSRPGSIFSGKPGGTTIIHNNVIPVHLTATGTSAEKDILDSYGQNVPQYPPLRPGDIGNSNGYQTQTINHLHQHHSHRYQNNKYITSVTTVSPMLSSTPISHNPDYEHHSAYLQSEHGVTTPSPFEYQQPTPATIETSLYTPSPHLNENNVNQIFQATERYPTVQVHYGNVPRPLDPHSYQQQSVSSSSPFNTNALFPTLIEPHKVKIRPNAQKFESIEEMDSEDVLVGGGDRHTRPLQQQQHQQQQQQLLTYNYNGEQAAGVPSQLTHLSHMGPNTLLGLNIGGNKNTYLPRPPQTNAYGSTLGELGTNKPKYPLFGSQLQSQQSSGYSDGTHLINIGGNFINLDTFQNSILPLIGSSSTLSELNNVEVISCAAGVRQPNATDCTRYYVCSKKDGKVLSYSCPPYTAFNTQTRICDAHTYSMCSPDALLSSYTVNENKRLHMEAIKALQDAKRRREQALKAQNLANLLSQYNAGASAISTHQSIEDQMSGVDDNDSNEKDMLSSYVQQAASMTSSNTISSTTSRPVKKRKYYCKEGDKIADQTSIYSYFVCYKNAQGMMKGHKMICSKGLVFCPRTSMCTLTSKCM